ncbi:MAG: hypothetical protein BWY57_02382 [Betaproteobacteria bacterium ADurb.Bin341]|nr:MAG: hypothetical protein BWY57_02382 [Betaproteobacteria bacterium ADurb.Bin341]
MGESRGADVAVELERPRVDVEVGVLHAAGVVDVQGDVGGGAHAIRDRMLDQIDRQARGSGDLDGGGGGAAEGDGIGEQQLARLHAERGAGRLVGHCRGADDLNRVGAGFGEHLTVEIKYAVADIEAF